MSLERWQVIDFDIHQDQMDWFPRLPATSVWRNRRWKLGMTRLNKMLIKLMMPMLMVEELQLELGNGNECLECTDFPESVTILPAWQRPQGHGELRFPPHISTNMFSRPAPGILNPDVLAELQLSGSLEILGLSPNQFSGGSLVFVNRSLEIHDLSPNQFSGGSLVFMNREDTNHLSVVQSIGHLAGIVIGSLEILGLSPNQFSGGSLVDCGDTNHLSVVQSIGHLAGIVIGVVAITPTIALATYLILRGRWFKKHGYPTARAFSPPGVNIQSERPDLSEKLISRMLRSFHVGLMAVIIRLKGEQTRVLDDRQWA